MIFAANELSTTNTTITASSLQGYMSAGSYKVSGVVYVLSGRMKVGLIITESTRNIYGYLSFSCNGIGGTSGTYQQSKVYAHSTLTTQDYGAGQIYFEGIVQLASAGYIRLGVASANGSATRLDIYSYIHIQKL